MNIASHFTQSPDSSRLLRELAWVMLFAALIKLAWLAADHTLRLYMGDSMVYLQTAAWLSGTPGRSFLYGAILHFTVQPLQSPLAIIALQSLWSMTTVAGLFVFLRMALGLGAALSACAALALALEPAQVFLERMVMAETAGLLALIVTLLAYSRYLFKGSLTWYLVGCLFGLATANFRTSLLPIVLGLGIAAPLIYLFAGQRPLPGWRSCGRHLACVASLLLVTHVAYTQAYGHAMKSPPGYLALTGMMRIGLVAPLIEPRHFEGTGVSGEILRQVRPPLKDHWQRGNQIWGENGLWRTLEKNTRDPERVARVITRRAMLDHPIQLLQMNLETLGGYVDPDKVYWRMLDDKGVIAPDEKARQLVRQWLQWDVRGIDAAETPARIYFAASYRWLTACLFLLTPLAAATLFIGWRRPGRKQYVLLATASLGLVASHLLFSHIVSFRYLHPFPWFVLANLAVILSSWGPFSGRPKAGVARAAGDTPAP